MPANPTISLLRHPTSPAKPEGQVSASADFDPDGSLKLRYRACFAPGTLRIPSAQPAVAADGLWQHTCCEAFLGEAGTAYREFNFSPSGQWACYRFKDYRERDPGFEVATAPTVRFALMPDGFELHALIPVGLLPDAQPIAVSLTTITETTKVDKQYWALSHCADQPDFHLRQSFRLSLTRPAP